MHMGELVRGKIINRYKRFLADVDLEDGSDKKVTVFVPNTGRMTSCWNPGDECLLKKSENTKRKYSLTLEMLHNGQTWIGVNTHRSNSIVEEALKEGLIGSFGPILSLVREVKFGHSRFDFCLTLKDNTLLYLEVKNVTLKVEGHFGAFPDAKSDRGTKHLKELALMSQEGIRTAVLFLVQREDVLEFRPAWECDRNFALALIDAKNRGVEILCYGCKLLPQDVSVSQPIPIKFDPQ